MATMIQMALEWDKNTRQQCPLCKVALVRETAFALAFLNPDGGGCLISGRSFTLPTP
jgi:hypothetical protein